MQLLTCDACRYGHAFFSALAPNSHVKRHFGPTNKKLRVQLPLIVPEGMGQLRSANQIVSIRCVGAVVLVAPLLISRVLFCCREGEPFVFDDSHDHEAWNRSETASRIILIFDVWHPDLTQKEIKV